MSDFECCPVLNETEFPKNLPDHFREFNECGCGLALCGNGRGTTCRAPPADHYGLPAGAMIFL
jgi:hypothetical protein